jgi:hypothetical protein
MASSFIVASRERTFLAYSTAAEPVDSLQCARKKRGAKTMDAAKQAELEAALVLMSRAVRNKLDRVRIKVHLKEWQALSLDQRAQLRDAPCESAAEVDRFAALVDEWIERCTGRAPDRLPHE